MLTVLVTLLIAETNKNHLREGFSLQFEGIQSVPYGRDEKSEKCDVIDWIVSVAG